MPSVGRYSSANCRGIGRADPANSVISEPEIAGVFPGRPTGADLAALPAVLHLNDRQRDVLIEHLPDAANVAAGGLFFGQFIGDRPFSWPSALIGIGLWATLLIVSLLLARR